MNKLFTKIAALALGATMAVGVGVAFASNSKVAEPVNAADQLAYTLTFGTGTNSSTAVTTSTTAATTMSGGTDYVTSTPYTSLSGNVYKSGTSNALKIGKSGSAGSVTLALSNSGKVKATKIVINARNIGGSKNVGATINVNSLGAQTSNDSTFTDMTYTYGSATDITGITIASNKSVFINTVKVYISGSTPLTSITLGGAASSNAMSIGSSDFTAKTVSVTLNPSGATDQKVNIAHQSGTSGLFSVSSSATCTSGSGSFTVTGLGNTSGSETFRIKGNTETSVYVDLVVTALDDSATYWTVSFDVDGGSASIADMEVEDGDSFEFPSPGTKTHYSFAGWSSDGGTTKYAAGATSPLVDDDIEYVAYWTEDAKYTVTYSAASPASGSYPHTNQYGGTYTLLAFASLSGITYDSSTYRFKNYTVGGVDKNPGETFTLSAATTVTVNFEEIPPTDTLTADIIGQTSYGDWSGKSGGATDAVYAGNSTKSSTAGAIQMRSSNSNSGIVTTTSGGTIKSVTVTWNKTEAPTQARTLDIYAKTTAYSAATDLYASGTQGTKVGSLSYTNTTTYESTLSITGDYTYVGVRSNSGALYLDDISFEWELPNQLSSIVLSGDYETSFASGDTFSFGGTVTAKYTKASDTNVTSSTTFHLDSASGSNMSGVTLTHAAHDGHTIYAKYTEGGITKTASYAISVANAPVSSVSIETHAAEVGFEEEYSISGITPTVLPADAVQTTEWVVSGNTVSDDYTWNGTTLTSGQTEGTITLRCRSTADNSKYDELVVTVTGDPTAEFVKASTSGYVGKSELIEFTYGNIDDVSKITVASSNTSYVTVANDLVADEGEGLVTINFVGAGSTTVTISYDGGETLDTLPVTVSADSVVSVSWNASNFDVFSGTTLTSEIDNTWLASYEMASGDEDLITYGEYTLKLGGTAITLPHTWVAADDGKTLCIEYGGVSSSTVSVAVTQTINSVLAPVPGEQVTSTLSFTEKYADGGATSSGGEEWTVESDGTESNFDNTKGIHYGTSSAAVQYIKLTTSDFASGTITSVVVNASTASGVSATASVTVGGNAFGGDAQSLSSSAADYTFTDEADAGEIVVTITKPSSATKAIYCKSIVVTYSTESGETVNIANNPSHKAAQRVAVAFAQAFNAAMDDTENCTTGLDDAWATCSSAYTSFKSAAAALGETEEAWAKNLVKYATVQWSDDSGEACIERMMKTYEVCVQKHGKNAFMSDLVTLGRASNTNPITIIGAKSDVNVVAIVVITSVVSLTAIGGYFFLRKRKENI